MVQLNPVPVFLLAEAGPCVHVPVKEINRAIYTRKNKTRLT